MNDRLPSCRCVFAPPVPTEYAPGRFSRRCGHIPGQAPSPRRLKSVFSTNVG